MASAKVIIKAELDPANPVPEICAVIGTVLELHRGREDAILLGLIEAIEQRRQHKGADQVG
jgi:hypothetical protein